MDPREISEYLKFYRDLGITELELEPRRSPSPSASPADREAAAAPKPKPQTAPAAPPDNLLSMAAGPENADLAGDSVEALRVIQDDIGDCTRCRLHQGRTQIVFGVGNPKAKLIFVGEGPGADEDAQGIPFVGRAGQLLTQMIERTAEGEGIPIRRKDVYICNVVKCRPPGNRAPEPDEMEICGRFLKRQLEAIHPKAICVLGGTAAKALLNTKTGITKLRGEWHRWGEIPVMPTFHPSFLLRAYNKDAKRLAWEDLKKVLHFVYE